MHTVYFMFFQVASATATRYGLSRGLLGLKYDQINYSDSDSVVINRLISTMCNIDNNSIEPFI